MEITNDVLLERIDNFICTNKDEHGRIIDEIRETKEGVAKTNGTVADLSRGAIQVKVVIWLLGFFVTAVVVPVLVYQLNAYFSKIF